MQIAPLPMAKQLWEASPMHTQSGIATTSNKSDNFSSKSFAL